MSWPEMGPSYSHTHTHSCTSLHTHAHTKWTAPSPADTLGHMHTGAAHSPLHTDTPTPAPAPTSTHLHPHRPPSQCPRVLPPARQGLSLEGPGCSWRGRWGWERASELGPAPWAPGVSPPPPAGLMGLPLVQGGGLGEGFGAQSSPPGSQDLVPTSPCRADGPTPGAGRWAGRGLRSSVQPPGPRSVPASPCGADGPPLVQGGGVGGDAAGGHSVLVQWLLNYWLI